MEPPELVRRRPRLTLVTTRGGPDVSHAKAAHLPVIAIIVIGHDYGRGLLSVLLAPLIATLDAFLNAMSGGIGRCLLVTAWGRLPLPLAWRSMTTS
jgi:hypothetical protein